MSQPTNSADYIDRVFASLEPYRLENTDSELDLYRVTKIQFTRMKEDLHILVAGHTAKAVERAKIEAQLEEVAYLHNRFDGHPIAEKALEERAALLKAQLKGDQS